MFYEVVYINETLPKLLIRRGLKRLKRPDLEPWAYLRCKQSHKKKVVQRRNHCCYSRNRCRHTHRSLCILPSAFTEESSAAWPLFLAKKVIEHFISLATGLKRFPLIVSEVVHHSTSNEKLIC